MIRMIAVPNSLCRSFISSMICACTVTSRAVVGSSAIRRLRVERERHRDHRPLSHPARELVRVVVDALLGLRDADAVEQLDRAPPCLGLARRSRGRWIASTICQPTRYCGWRLESGSWKISAIFAPRTCRSSSGPIVSRSRPSKSAWPETRAPCVRPTIVCVATLFPEPDSPTIPSVRPLSTPNEMPRTACTTTVRRGKRDGQVLERRAGSCRNARGFAPRASETGLAQLPVSGGFDWRGLLRPAATP